MTRLNKLKTPAGVIIAIAAAAVLYMAITPETPTETTDAPQTVVEIDYPDNSGGEDMYRSRRISATQARELMTRYPNAIILDVRSEGEFATGHIPGAILLPDFEISAGAEDVLTDKYALILVYCQSGNRSRGATSLLMSMGYMNVYDFGGINTWPY